jgi:hypothetical protein
MKSDAPLHERIEDPGFRQAVHLIDTGDVAALRDHLNANRYLMTMRVHFDDMDYFTDPGLLEFIAENPVRHGRLPANIVTVAQVILDAGARSDRRAIDSTLALVASGRVAREAGVQVPLIDLLCEHAADPNPAMAPALTHGEFDAVHALVRRGATVDFAGAAALGQAETVQRLLPAASVEQRHRALAWATQFGHRAIVEMLLDAGEDPNRYNPPGLHAHSTPLHQAALAGHDAVVRLLVERGAQLDIRDRLHQGTPLEWAEYAGQSGVAAWLRRQPPM